MAVSDRSDWPPCAVESADPETAAIWYLDCNGFVIKGSEGVTLFADLHVGIGDPPRMVRMIPVPLGPEDVTEVDAVLATHKYTDHVRGQSQAPILENTGAMFVVLDGSLLVAYDGEAWFNDYDPFEDQFEEVMEGDGVDIDEFTVHVEPVYDPDVPHPIAYVFEHESRTFIRGGGTKPVEEFAGVGERYDLDLGILALGTAGNTPDKETSEPVRTTWYNDESQIVETAGDFDLDHLVPTRWDMWKGMTADSKVPHHHAKSSEAPRSLDLVETDDCINL